LVNKSILSEGFSYKLPIALFLSYVSFKTHQDLGSRSLINYKSTQPVQKDRIIDFITIFTKSKEKVLYSEIGK
jgi:hypothetical protein